MISFFNVVIKIYQHLVYGLSLLFPYESDRPSFITIPSFTVFGVSIFVFSKILPSSEAALCVSLVIFFICLIYVMKSDRTLLLLIYKLRVEKYYRIQIPNDKINDFSFLTEAIRLHRKYGKDKEYSKYDRQVGRLKYIDDQSLIKEFRRFNRKWLFISVVYILLHVLAIFIWNIY